MALTTSIAPTKLPPRKTSVSRSRLQQIVKSGQYVSHYGECAEVSSSGGSISSKARKVDAKFGALIDAIELGNRKAAMDELMLVLDRQRREGRAA